VGMWDLIIQIAAGSWETLGAMAPYLLFGFLVAGLLSVLVPPRLVEQHLGGRGPWPVVKAAAFGVPLPLCSCGVIPVAASLRRHGATRGATTAFLLSTPQTGVDSIAVTYSLLGGVFAVFRPIAALVMGIIGGWLVEWLDPARQANGGEHGPECEDECCAPGEKRNPLVRIVQYGFVTLPRDIGGSLLIGLAVAGLISAAVPKDYFSQYLGPGLLQMIVMMLVGIPIYVCATASVPIAAVLIAKGISPGAALCFLITGPATNAATITTIWKVMGRRTAVIYLATVAGGALASGILLDLIYTHTAVGAAPQHVHEMAPGIFEIASSIALLAVLGLALVPWRRRRAEPESASPEKALLSIVGMTCSHCVESVTRALRGVAGVASAVVDLQGGWAVVHGAGLDPARLVRAVTDLGYKATVVEGPGVTAPALHTLTLAVEGMTCEHCAGNVQKALEKVEGVAAVEVDLKGGQAKVWGQHLDPDALCHAISQAGYSATVAVGEAPGASEPSRS